MQNIKDFIKEQLRHSVDLGCRLNYEYNEMLEFYDGNIPEHIAEQFVKDYCIDYIGENLKTHDVYKLRKKIEQYYADDIVEIDTLKGKAFFIEFSDEETAKKIVNDERFKNMLEFFNYFVTTVKGETVYIEALYSEDMTSTVFNDCKGVCYHFTDEDSANRIVKTGLRIKEGTYRLFPRRIYLYATPNVKLDTEDISSLIEIKEFINKVISPSVIKDNKLALLKIDLNKMKNINVYSDDAMVDNENCYFVLNNIPASCIKKINVPKEILEYL